MSDFIPDGSNGRCSPACGDLRIARGGLRTGVLIVGHGSREQAANLEFEQLVERFREHAPGLDVGRAYIELAEPLLAQGLADLARRNDRVMVLPCFLFAAGHVKNDIPVALEAARHRFPQVKFEAGRILGVHPAMVEIAFERARSVFDPLREQATRTAAVIVGRGSSDPDANGDFCKLVRLFGEGRGYGWVFPCFIGITRPLFEEAIEAAARMRPERILVVPYMLFAGLLVGRLREQAAAFARRHPRIKTRLAPPLGVHEKLLALLEERMREGLDGHGPLACDNCHYRVPIGGIVENVGGLRALLWSVRHTVTHNQGAPHAADRPLRKHVLVCGDADCAAAASVGLIAALRRAIKGVGREDDIRVTRTGCMGGCGQRPTIAVYPDGVWYGGVKKSDVDELVREHLLGDRLVTRLLGTIME